jgi:hypothetical protein
MDELNPNNYVTRTMHDNWHKLVAVIVFKLRGAGGSIIITQDDVDRFTEELPDGAIVCDARGGRTITLRLVDRDEAKQLARKEGGLPS